MTPPQTTMICPPPLAFSFSTSSGSLVAGGERGDADDVDLFVDGELRRLVGRLEQRAGDDFESDIREGRGDDLGAAVMAVLTELGDEDLGPLAGPVDFGP